MARNVSPRTGAKRKRKPSTARDVVIDCPFDTEYAEIFNAIVFTVVRSGYRARCALEVDNAGGGQSILREHETFQAVIPVPCEQKGMTPEEWKFADVNVMAIEYVAILREESITAVDSPPKTA